MDINNRGSHSILILDDEKDIVTLTQHIVESAGYKTLTLTDPRDIYSIPSESYTLAIIGLIMPYMNGLEVLKYIKTASPYTPVIIVTGQFDIERAVESIRIGADDYLVKPLKTEKLLHSINLALDLRRTLQDKERAKSDLIDYINSLKEDNYQLNMMKEDLLTFITSSDVNSKPIIRSIEFDENSYQAGISILTYFSTIVNQKYPKTKIKIRIEQEETTVRLVIETPEGEKEQIEKTLEDYGFVVVGEMLPEELLSNPLQAIQLRHKLEMTVMELNHTRELLSVARASYDRELIELKKQIGEALKRESDANILLHKVIDKYSLDGPSKDAVSKLIYHLDNGISESDKAIIMELIGIIKKQNTTAFEDLRMFFITSLGGASGNLISGWINALYATLPK